MSALPAKANDDEPNPISAIRMEMVERLPPEFRQLVYEYGYIEEFWFEGWFEKRLKRLWAMTPEQRKVEVERRRAEIAKWENDDRSRTNVRC